MRDFLTREAVPYELNALKKTRLSAYAIARIACSCIFFNCIDLLEKFFYCKLAVPVKYLAVFFPGILGTVFLQRPFLNSFIQSRFVHFQGTENDILPESSDISFYDIPFREMLVNEIPGSAGDSMLGDTNMQVILPQGLCNRLRLRDIDGELFDHVPPFIVYMPVRAAIGYCKHLRIDFIFLQGFDELNRFFRSCQNHPVAIFSPNLPHLNFQAEILPFHPAFNITGQL